MKKYKIILILIFFLGYLFSVWTNNSEFYQHKNVKLKDLNISMLDLKTILAIDKDLFIDSNYTSWGLPKSRLLTKRELNKKEKLVSKKVKNNLHENNLFKSKNKLICLKKRCWEFLGIYTMENYKTVTLQEKKNSSKLLTYCIGDTLIKELKIVDISSTNLVLHDKKNDEKFVLKVFDVNVSKYQNKK